MGERLGTCEETMRKDGEHLGRSEKMRKGLGKDEKTIGKDKKKMRNDRKRGGKIRKR